MEPQKNYNILLLGETGVGKSTFINTLLNYVAYENLSEITDLKHSIGVRFTVVDANFEEQSIVIAQDKNEDREPGKSATKRPKKHSISLKDGSILNVIDTPGLGDTQGIENDYKNVENVLEFISEMEYLHGIWIMLKPNNSRLSVIFEYCIKTILGQLDQNIRKNVIFIFSNSRSSFYTPGDTKMPLEKILKSVDKTGRDPVPFNHFNTFCVESDWFRYVAAKKFGITFNDSYVSMFEDSFNKSSKEVKRLIEYIINLPPRQIKGLLSINEAKRLIRRLSSTIAFCLTAQRKKWRELKSNEEKSKTILSGKKQLEENLMVDTTTTATETTYVNTQQTTSTTKIGGSLSLTGIGPHFAQNQDSKFNERKNESTVILKQKGEDPDVKAKINENERDLEKVEQEGNIIKKEIKDLEEEFNTLLTASAQFNAFLKENVPFNSMDAIEVSLENMKKDGEIVGDQKDVKMYNRILKLYKAKKASSYNVSIGDVEETVKQLLSLKNSGPELKKKLEIDDEEKTGNRAESLSSSKPLYISGSST